MKRLLFAAGLLLALPGPEAAVRAQQPAACDRACLDGMLSRFLDAVAAEDPARAPLAIGFRQTQNSLLTPAGAGVWQTLSALGRSPRRYFDPVTGNAVFFGVVTDGGQPAVASVRVRVENGAITEAEHLVVRSFNGSSLDNLKTPRPGLLTEIPPAQRAPREVLLAIGMTYYDSIEQSSGDATPFADDCERRENGMITAGGTGTGLDGQPRLGCHAQMDSRTFTYIDSIDFRRVWIADPVTGLVFGLSQFRHSMKDKQITVIGRDGKPTTRDVAFNPFDLPAAHIFKVRDNRIHEIEALGFMVPYMSKGGWSDFAR